MIKKSHIKVTAEILEELFMKVNKKVMQKHGIILLSSLLLIPLGSPILGISQVNAVSASTTSATIVWQGVWGTAPVSIDSNGLFTIGTGVINQGIPLNNVAPSWAGRVKSVAVSGNVSVIGDTRNLFTTPYGDMANISGLGTFDTSNATSLEGMFSTYQGTNLDTSHFNTSNVTNMNAMFYDNTNLVSLDLSSFDTHNVTEMASMFGGASNLHSLTLGTNFSFKIATSGYYIGNNAGLLDVTSMTGYDSSKYTGYWQNIGTGTAEHPNGTNVLTSAQLMATYNGTTMADTYVWQPISVPAAPITVNYVDDKGNTIAPSESLNGNVGDLYTSTQKAISGYTFKEVQGNTTGIYSDQAQTVTYVYTKDSIPAAAVTVNYVDDKGNTIAPSETLTGRVGASYTSNRKDVSGYTFKEIKGNATGTFTSSAQTVTYVYSKNPAKAALPPKGQDTGKTPLLVGNSTSSNELKNQATLPKTGEQTSFSAFGLGSSILTLALGILFSKSYQSKRK